MSNDDLRLAARRATDRAAGEVSSFTTEPIASGGVNSAVERFTGTLLDGGETVAFSVVRKVIRGGDDNLLMWAREPDAYSSGLLDGLDGVTAPQLLHQREDADGAGAVLWLEDVPGDSGPWSLDRFELVARGLGRFAAPFATGERPIPPHQWLSSGWLEDWVSMAASSMAELDGGIDDPMVHRVYPPEVVDGLRRLWGARGRILGLLRRLPAVLGHLDATPANTLVIGQRVVLLDWAFTGRATLAEDLGSLVGASTLFANPPVSPSDLPAIASVAIRGYTEGLTAGGCSVDADVIRWVVAATAALRYAVGTTPHVVKGMGVNGPPPDGVGIRDPNYRAMFAHTLGRPFPELLDVIADTEHFLVLDLGEHALSSLRTVERSLN
jgi:hypothetical protein